MENTRERFIDILVVVGIEEGPGDYDDWQTIGS